ncbi:MAG: alpha/beta hydrolase [Phycisphaerae bacterium]
MKRSTRRRMIWWFIITPLAAYGLLAAFLFLMQGRMVYDPTRQWEGTPCDVGLRFEDLTLRAADGVKLSAWYVPNSDSNAPVVLLCHGNGGNLSHRLGTLRQLHEMGVSALIIDYRGYGRSEGSPSEQGTYRDARAAWDWLVEQRQVDPSRIVLMGRSLGGAIASHLAGQVSPAGLVIESAPTSIPEMGRDMYPIFPLGLMRFLARYRYDTREHLAGVDCPVLVMHSPDDGLIPFSHGQRNFEAAGEPRRLVELTGTHNDAHEVSGGVYTRAFEAFVARCVK